MTKKKKLTAKQKRFCDQWLLCMNASEAARRAGYSEKTAGSIGGENLQKPEIKAYIDERKQQEEEILGFSRFTLISDLQEIKGRCMQKVPVMIFDKVEKEYIQETAEVEHEDGTVTEEGIWQFDARGAIGSISEISKMMPGYHAPARVANADGNNLPPPVTQINYLPPAGGDHT